MKKKIIDILGLGPSIKDYTPSGFTIIGVNDIARHFTPHHLVITDIPKKTLYTRQASEGRKDLWEVIQNTRAEKTWTSQRQWCLHFSGKGLDVVLIRTHPWYLMGGIPSKGQKDPVFPTAANTTFLAICLARWLGATEIRLYGVDFSAEWIRDQSEKINQDFSVFLDKEYMWLKKNLEETTLKVHPESYLAKFFETL